MWNDMSGRKGKNSSIYKKAYQNKTRVDWKLLNKETFLAHLQNREKNTPLHLAVHRGNKPMIRELLQHPNIIEVENKYGNRALHIAAMCGKLSVLQMILAKNANLYAKNKLGCSALYIAADHQRYENLELLLEYGANVNDKAKKCFNDTALHKAVRGENKEIVLALLMYGADPEMENDYGNSPIFLAFSYPHISLHEMLPSDQNILKVLIAFCMLWDIQEWKASCFTDSFASSFKPFTIQCEEEIKRAKLLILGNSGLSYYDVLKCNIKEIAFLLRKQWMKVILRSKLNLEIFPIYSEMYDFKINAGIKCEYLVKESSECLQTLLKDYLLLPDLIAKNIVSYLDIGDLRNLTCL
ncbi:26S proteasome non-ATPase regulatory subunit 10-like [Uloborus diversus]|uniref:26S proteasome non-ATPase regulatory subunit 10-like n=1 Tax=Uloborus diversus TaxID=327109 RepID=UPI00240A89A7|nr:26S proteasome non-ATPase regulatory subunit 10-like [Uloborus diversus]